MTVSHDSETPAHGQQVITACAFIHHNFDGVVKVFLPKRADSKKFLPGVYELPGGHIDIGENIIDGLRRELLEEFEVHTKIGDPFAVFDYTNHIKGSHSVEIVYFATLLESPESIVIHPDDHSTFVWASREELPEIFSGQKGQDDPEYKVLQKGFDLLEGNQPNFASEKV